MARSTAPLSFSILSSVTFYVFSRTFPSDSSLLRVRSIRKEKKNRILMGRREEKKEGRKRKKEKRFERGVKTENKNLEIYRILIPNDDERKLVKLVTTRDTFYFKTRIARLDPRSVDYSRSREKRERVLSGSTAHYSLRMLITNRTKRRLFQTRATVTFPPLPRSSDSTSRTYIYCTPFSRVIHGPINRSMDTSKG